VVLGFLVVVLLLTGLVFVRVLAGYPQARARFSNLGRGEVAFLDAAAETMFPDGGAIPLSGREADLPGYLDDYFVGLPSHLCLQIRALFLLFEHATLVFPAPGSGGRRRFSSLSNEQRGAVFEGWQSSRLFLRRLPFSALRAVLTMGYLGHPAAMRHLKVAPLWIDTPVCEADLLYPPVGESREAIALGPEDITPPSTGVPLDFEGPLHPDYQPVVSASADGGPSVTTESGTVASSTQKVPS
jgi:hypothetical protein